ncbi:hypothetical protein SUVZ_13G1420 [Saccharomyces uvarum]|uniref:SAP domain-containing protein n=1 Tax=Saccharomyces uvarum TaxID=230603 RepID=A0ABN8WMZ2_SACUV|nr:hypothetical protein SUVZ_13G1420 [Saccharomyces uvarum]
MSLSLFSKFVLQKSPGRPTLGLGRFVSLPYTSLLKRPNAPCLYVHRYVHSTQTKSHLTFILNSNDMISFQKFTVKILKEQCKSRGLKLSGRKSDLLQRLITYDSRSYMKKNSKLQNEPTSSLLADKPIKVNSTHLSEKIPKIIDKKHFSVQKASTIQSPCEVHQRFQDADLQLRDKIFLVGFVMVSCLWWNLEAQESKPTIGHH